MNLKMLFISSSFLTENNRNKEKCRKKDKKKKEKKNDIKM